jgi:hypothetical protein
MSAKSFSNLTLLLHFGSSRRQTGMLGLLVLKPNFQDLTVKAYFTAPARKKWTPLKIAVLYLV